MQISLRCFYSELTLLRESCLHEKRRFHPDLHTWHTTTSIKGELFVSCLILLTYVLFYDGNLLP